MSLERKNVFILFSVCFLLFFAFPFTASADMGPKPSITVIVKNPPSGEYYLDLLRCYTNEDKATSYLDKKDQYDQTKLSLLDHYDTNGWRSALVHGTKAPLFGQLTGEMEN